MRFRGTIRDVATTDLAAVDAIFESWFVGAYGNSTRDEVDAVIADVAASIGAPPTSASRHYLVAEADGVVVGVMGMQFDGDAVEILRAYMAPESVGTGAGTALADSVEERAKALGCTNLVVISGARNRESGYWFWDRRYGERVSVDEDYFAPGAERVVWAKTL